MKFQLGAALLDACVLAALAESDTYGYVLTQRVQAAMDISESSLYPVLRRLQKDGQLTVYDQAIQGRNRRYYSITRQGRTLLRQYQADWKDFQDRVSGLLSGKVPEGPSEAPGTVEEPAPQASRNLPTALL